mmetsp:Transcript_114187/g.301531  ORF Transcript_114187/g.301531 Transcript_114187/m.301531 type:complete len:233 (-) Transcript_114187:543-1241(-)
MLLLELLQPLVGALELLRLLRCLPLPPVPVLARLGEALLQRAQLLLQVLHLQPQPSLAVPSLLEAQLEAADLEEERGLLVAVELFALVSGAPHLLELFGGARLRLARLQVPLVGLQGLLALLEQLLGPEALLPDLRAQLAILRLQAPQLRRQVRIAPGGPLRGVSSQRGRPAAARGGRARRGGRQRRPPVRGVLPPGLLLGSRGLPGRRAGRLSADVRGSFALLRRPLTLHT